MNAGITSTEKYLEMLEKDLGKLEYDLRTLRKWVYLDKKIFFDCETSDLEGQLKQLLERRDLSRHVVLAVVKNQAQSLSLRSITYTNIGNKTIEDFIKHFTLILKTPMTLELQLEGLELVDCVGYSYVTSEEAESLGS
ncbi:hypothetical protein [Candidatus Hecatella orcuttiae]|uniref:hypothetical protein n=1 Tax=Candidatus Hecatella orcuttiae TaxID=1935119 RepID=UPI002868390A|nr:hypothetical protein [Candidatus Hecatella orcuttiae]